MTNPKAVAIFNQIRFHIISALSSFQFQLGYTNKLKLAEVIDNKIGNILVWMV